MGLAEFPFIQQYRDFYCGPACVQMMCKFLNPAFSSGWGTQYNIGKTENKTANIDGNFISHENWVNPKNTIWSTTPPEIKNMLHALSLKEISLRSLKEFSLIFATSAQVDETQSGNLTDAISEDRKSFISELVARCEYAKKQSASGTGSTEPAIPPPIVPIHTNSHWVLLHDVKETQVDGETVRTLVGKDPWKLTWSTTSGIASNSGTINIPVKEHNFLNPENFVLLANISADKNLFIVPIPVPKMKYTIPHRDDISQAARTASRLQVVASEKVHAILSADFKNHSIRIPRGLTPTRPLLVKVLEKYRPDYYLVTYKDKEENASFIARADAYTGELIDTLQIDPTRLALTNSDFNPETALSVAMAHIPADGRLRTVRRKALLNELERVAKANEGDSQLVWRPCPESESAFFPFFQVTDGNNQSFVRIDGKPFNQLSVKTVPDSNQT